MTAICCDASTRSGHSLIVMPLYFHATGNHQQLFELFAEPGSVSTINFKFQQIVRRKAASMSDILTASQKEVARLVDAFRQISSMQVRMKLLELAERFARDNPKLNGDLTGLSHAVVFEDRKVIAIIRQRQSFDDKANCA